MFRGGSRAPSLPVVPAGLWRRVRGPMRLPKWTRKMPSQQYNLVTNDEFDTRIPLHSEEAFHYGITFKAKYIGTMDVPRPTNRIEIVAAMRRVRYEFKAKGVKKRKVTVDISTDGVRVTTRKKKGSSKKNPSSKFFGRGNKTAVNEGVELMHHPIYRIFYVSHDSSDLKIFSYIARDGATNVFKCNVFKSSRKSQAMRIVRTVGQAFEVCHQMQHGSDQVAASTTSAVDEATDRASELAFKADGPSECGASESGAASTSRVAEDKPVSVAEPARPSHLELLPPPPRKEGKRSPQRTPAPSINLAELPECVTKVEASDTVEGEASTPLSAQHQLQLLRERLEQQVQQTRAAVAQLLLLRDQLAAEQAARCEAQARTHQLLVHNKELLEHIAALVAHLQERERGGSRPISAQQLTLLPQAADRNTGDDLNSEAVPCNGNNQEINTETLIHLLGQSNKMSHSKENNNTRLSPFSLSPNIPASPINGPPSAPSFEGMTNEQIQTYLISRFQNMDVVGGTLETNGDTNTVSNHQYYQNSNAFPNMVHLTNHFSNADLVGLVDQGAYKNLITVEGIESMTQPMSVGHSEISLCSNSQATTSKDSTPDAISSDDGVPFIMPLSHNGTLAATGEDGRVRLIVPVSPSGSASDVVGVGHRVQATSKGSSDMTLKVPGALLTPAGPITRSTSEKVPNRSEMMAAMRSQWTRHTTK